MHLGGVRTALFNWLFSRQGGPKRIERGTVLLRLEDTDPTRSEEVYADDIIESLRWLGLDWDGDVIRQSDRSQIYREHLARLEESGAVYRCYCPARKLEKAREMARAVGRHWRYPRTCRELPGPPTPDAPYVLRLKVPDADSPAVMDRIVGRIVVGGPDIDDFVLTRSDGTPLYNLCCVVDDALLGVTHVIRGADHVDNTRRQALLYDALGYKRPEFAHLPLVSGLSKRRGSDSVLSFRDRGFLPEAVINFVARLGWSYEDEEVFDLDELVELFRLEHVGHSAARVNEEKLLWLNEQHLHRTRSDRLAELLRPLLVDVPEHFEERVAPAAELYRTRCKTLIELADAMGSCLAEDHDLLLDHPEARELLNPSLAATLGELSELVAQISPWERIRVKHTMWELLETRGTGFRQVAPSCRLALTGKPAGPRILDLMLVLGPATVSARLRRAAAHGATLWSEDLEGTEG